MAATTNNGDLKAQLDAAQAAATKQGDTVRSLKALAKDGKADKAWHCPLHSLHYVFDERKAAHDERAGVEGGLWRRRKVASSAADAVASAAVGALAHARAPVHYH